jgi:uncharacterized cupredoxin-like copper-binding protein
MKRALLLPVFVAALLLLTACGAPAAAELAPTSAPTDAQPVLTSAPVDQPTSAAGGATEVDITLADNTIQSSLTTFKAGVPYRFVIINNGRHPHSFSINPPVDVAGSLDTAQAKALMNVDQGQLPLGGGTTVTYTFPASAVGQQLEMSCLIRRHYDDGMRLAITVTN